MLLRGVGVKVERPVDERPWRRRRAADTDRRGQRRCVSVHGDSRCVCRWGAAGAQAYLGARTSVASFGHKRIDGVPRGGWRGAAVQSRAGRPAGAGEQRHIGNWSRRSRRVLESGLV